MSKAVFTPHGAADTEAVIDLWRRCDLLRPWNDPCHDIDLVKRSGHGTLLIGRLAAGGPVLATVMVGHDGHRGWIYYLAVDPDYRRGGLGRQAVQAAEDWLRHRGLAKAMLMIRAENEAVRAFYERCGYGVEERIVMSRRIGSGS